MFIKERWPYRYMGFLLCAFPNAKYIYQVRDPRDMALSWRNSLVRGKGIVDGAKFWQEEQRHNIRLYTLLKEHGKTILLRYEDLLKNPTNELQRICHFMNLHFDMDMLNFHQSKNAIANADAEIHWINLKKPLMKANYGKYKSDLNESEIRYVEGLCQAEMQFLGYQRDHNISHDLSGLEMEVTYLDKTYRTIHPKSYPENEQVARAVRDEVLRRIEQRG